MKINFGVFFTLSTVFFALLLAKLAKELMHVLSLLEQPH